MGQTKEWDASRNKCVKRITKVYKGMRERCNNPNHIGYHLYGGRGIKVIISRKAFIEWYLNHVTDDMIRPNVDRIDNNGHYEISNIQLIPARKNAQKMLKENPRWDVKQKNMDSANAARKMPVWIDGKKYNSGNEASRALGKSKNSVRLYAKRHNTRHFKTKKQGSRIILVPDNSKK